MSLNGSGVFNVNSAGQPVVADTLITAAAFNAFTADIATALSTAIFKDGQQTVTNNLPMGGFRLTGVGLGIAATDAASLQNITNLALGTMATQPTSVLGMTLIASAVAANSATVDFTSGIDSTYDEYLIACVDVLPATDAVALNVRFSEDAGSTFKAGATDYRYSIITSNDGGAPTAAGSAGATAATVALALGNTASKPCCGEIRFFNPAGTTKHKAILSSFSIELSSNNISTQPGTGLFQLDTNAVNGVRLLLSAGNITSGNFYLFGIRKA